MMRWNQLSRTVTKSYTSHRCHIPMCYHQAQAGIKTTTPATLDKIFSTENVERCKNKLLSVQPIRYIPWAKMKTLKQAAVLVPLCTVKGEPSIMFTLRSQKLTSYRGQVSFPGGMVDDTDDHRIQTAIRESEEEIGLDPGRVNVWGCLSPVPGRNFETAVTPVLAFCDELDWSRLKISEDEVSEVFTCSIESLCKPENNRYTQFRGKYNYCLPAFTGQPHRIWGLTAIVLHQTLMLLAPELYTFKFTYR